MNTEDKDFIIKIIQCLQVKYGIIFFISTTDFDALYNWWEKRIPLHIVKESIDNVVERWAGKNKKIYSFSNFSYEVKKNFQAFLQLNVGSGSREPGLTGGEIEQTPDPYERFFNNFPDELNPLKGDFESAYQQRKNNEPVETEPLFQKLVGAFKDDNELDVKTGIFLRNLAPELRKPEIENRYRLNYLLNKFSVPDFF